MDLTPLWREREAKWGRVPGPTAIPRMCVCHYPHPSAAQFLKDKLSQWDECLIPSHNTNGPFSSKHYLFSAVQQLLHLSPWASLFCIWEVLTKEGDWWEEFMFSAGYQVTRAYRCQHYCSTLEFLALLLSSTLAGFCVTFKFKSRALPRERVQLNQKIPNWSEDSSKPWWWKPFQWKGEIVSQLNTSKQEKPHTTIFFNFSSFLVP